MLCDICHKKEATIYYTEIINGEKKEQKLCEKCATECSDTNINTMIFNKELPLIGLLTEILGGAYGNLSVEHEVKAPTKVCKVCKMTEEEFIEQGKFGCSSCYDAFNTILARSIKKFQNGDKHAGKVPKGYISKTNKIVNELTEIEKLTIKLQEAIEKEEFEEAANLRDTIKGLKEGDEINA